MKILAFDPSSTHVGWCLAEGTVYSQSGVYVPKGKADARVALIQQWAKRKIRMFSPEVVVLEEPAGKHGNLKADRLLARVGGVIEAMALDRSALVRRVWPTQVKATKCCKDNLVYARGVAGKENVGPDEADAIGVWLAYLKVFGEK